MLWLMIGLVVLSGIITFFRGGIADRVEEECSVYAREKEDKIESFWLHMANGVIYVGCILAGWIIDHSFWDFIPAVLTVYCLFGASIRSVMNIAIMLYYSHLLKRYPETKERYIHSNVRSHSGYSGGRGYYSSGSSHSSNGNSSQTSDNYNDNSSYDDCILADPRFYDEG